MKAKNKAKNIKKYKSGGFGRALGDIGLSLGDMTTNAIGLDVIHNDMYNTKWGSKVGEVGSSITKAAAPVVAGAFLGAPGSMGVSALQQGLGAVSPQDENKSETGQYADQFAGIVGNLTGQLMGSGIAKPNAFKMGGKHKAYDLYDMKGLSHELGGIKYQDGEVEGGEQIMELPDNDKMIFSDKINIGKVNTFLQENGIDLSKYKNKTMAQAIKSANSRFKGKDFFAENSKKMELSKEDSDINKLIAAQDLIGQRFNPSLGGEDDYEEFIGKCGGKYKEGGIHINPENKGKFTATKKRTGKSTEELTHSKNPLTRKRAIFAQNAAKWSHQEGGELPWIDDQGNFKKLNTKKLIELDKSGDKKLREAYTKARMADEGLQATNKNDQQIIQKAYSYDLRQLPQSYINKLQDKYGFDTTSSYYHTNDKDGVITAGKYTGLFPWEAAQLNKEEWDRYNNKQYKYGGEDPEFTFSSQEPYTGTTELAGEVSTQPTVSSNLSRQQEAYRDLQKGDIDEIAFREKAGMSPHRYQQETDPAYLAQSLRERDRIAQIEGTFDYPSSYTISKNFKGTPNSLFMSGNATNQKLMNYNQQYHNDVIGSFLPGLEGLKMFSKGTKVAKGAKALTKTLPKVAEPVVENPLKSKLYDWAKKHADYRQIEGGEDILKRKIDDYLSNREALENFKPTAQTSERFSKDIEISKQFWNKEKDFLLKNLEDEDVVRKDFSVLTEHHPASYLQDIKDRIANPPYKHGGKWSAENGTTLDSKGDVVKLQLGELVPEGYTITQVPNPESGYVYYKKTTTNTTQGNDKANRAFQWAAKNNIKKDSDFDFEGDKFKYSFSNKPITSNKESIVASPYNTIEPLQAKAFNNLKLEDGLTLKQQTPITMPLNKDLLFDDEQLDKNPYNMLGTSAAVANTILSGISNLKKIKPNLVGNNIYNPSYEGLDRVPFDIARANITNSARQITPNAGSYMSNMLAGESSIANAQSDAYQGIISRNVDRRNRGAEINMENKTQADFYNTRQRQIADETNMQNRQDFFSDLSSNINYVVGDLSAQGKEDMNLQLMNQLNPDYQVKSQRHWFKPTEYSVNEKSPFKYGGKFKMKKYGKVI